MSTGAALAIALSLGGLSLAQAPPANPQSPPPSGDPAEGGLSPELLRRAVNRWGQRLVRVEIWLQRSEGQRPDTGNARPRAEYEDRRPVEVPGLVVEPRAILIADPLIERRFIARWRIDVEGKGHFEEKAELLGAHLLAPIWVLRPEKPLEKFEPLPFAPASSPAPEPRNLLALSASFEDGGWTFSLAPAWSEIHQKGPSLWAEGPPGALILDRRLEAVGFSSNGRMGLEGSRDLWRGADLARGPVIELASLGARRGELARFLAARSPTVRGFLRREEEAEPSMMMHRIPSFSRLRGEEEGSGEFLASAYALTGHLLLVNHRLSREGAMRLERLSLLSGGSERPGRFAGVLREYHAFLMEIDGSDLEPLDLSHDGELEPGRAVLVIGADHAFGKRRERVELNRVGEPTRGFRGILEPTLNVFPRAGTLLLDPEGDRLLGAVLEVRRAEDEEEGGLRARGMIDLRIVGARELRRIQSAGAEAIDRRFAPRPAEREKDMVWFGADFQPLSRELARSHSIEIPTRGGEIGIIVLGVRPGSPAARAGVQPGDILLSLREEGESEAWEINPRGHLAHEDFLDVPSPDDLPEDVRDEVMAGTGAPWRSPRNFLTERLTRLGEGRAVELACLRGGEELKLSLPLEIAPPDFESAKQQKSEELGLTVKDLTYEVRDHYRLRDDAPGVVVSKVEEGSKAAIAKVIPFEILVSVNGAPVRNVEEFRRRLDEALPKGQDGNAPRERSLELKLERLGKSRIVRIRG